MPLHDGSVQMRLSLVLPDGVKASKQDIDNRPMFLPRDIGSVLGIDVDHHENAHMVRKKIEAMQSAFITLGGGVVNNEREDSRINDFQASGLIRSLSTPGSFLTKEVEARRKSGLVEVVGGLRCCPKMRSIIKQIVKGIEGGVEPIPVAGGLGGAYYFRNVKGENVAIVKPSDEEAFAPNNPKGFVGKSLGELNISRPVRVGETGVREVAAYLLDHKRFAGVPPTALVKISHHAFHTTSRSNSLLPIEKVGSCQQFVCHDFDASDHGSSRFSVSAVHRIAILDIRIFNTDRHSGNILVRKAEPFDNCAWNEALDLIPIDHGLCLPESLGDPYFEWLHWPQASLPFSEEEIAYIQQLDEFKDAELLRKELPSLREACLRVLILSTTVLKRGTIAGLCLAEIGEMISRDGIGGASQLEMLCVQAKALVEREFATENAFCYNEEDAVLVCPDDVEDGLYEQFEFEMDEDEDMLLSSLITDDSEQSCGETTHGIEDKSEFVESSPDYSSRARLAMSPRLRSLFSPPAEQEEVNVLFIKTGRKNGVSTACKVLASPRSARSYKSNSFNNRKQTRMDCRGGYKVLASETIRKGYNRAPPTFSLGDMDEKEWSCFLTHFRGLLQEVLVAKCNQKSGPRQRLGISCRF